MRLYSDKPDPSATKFVEMLDARGRKFVEMLDARGRCARVAALTLRETAWRVEEGWTCGLAVLLLNNIMSRGSSRPAATTLIRAI